MFVSSGRFVDFENAFVVCNGALGGAVDVFGVGGEVVFGLRGSRGRALKIRLNHDEGQSCGRGIVWACVAAGLIQMAFAEGTATRLNLMRKVVCLQLLRADAVRWYVLR